MKKMIAILSLVYIPLFAFAAENVELTLKGSDVEYDSCSMNGGYAVDSDIITRIQSKDVFFRIEPGNGYFKPTVVITNVDKRSLAHSNPVQFERCDLVKRCIDLIASESVGVVSYCDSKNILTVDFFQR